MLAPLRRLFLSRTPPETTGIAGLICVAISGVFSLLKPLIVGNAVNELARSVTRAMLLRYGLLLVGAAAVEGLFLFLQRRIIIGESRRIEYEMRNDFYGHLQSLPVSLLPGAAHGRSDFARDERSGLGAHADRPGGDALAVVAASSSPARS